MCHHLHMLDVGISIRRECKSDETICGITVSEKFQLWNCGTGRGCKRPGLSASKMVAIGTITYWCYISAVLFQGGVSLGFIFAPPMLVSVAADSYAQFFIRVTGICLLSLTQVFWGFRHISFQDASLASYSYGCARLFAKFHTMMAMLLFWSIYNAGMTIPYGQYLLGVHLVWAIVMTYAVVQHHRNVHGYIIDTASAPAAGKSFKQLVQGDDGDEARSVLQMIKGEDSSSKSVLQMLQDEIKTD